MQALDIVLEPVLSDNYAIIIHDPETGACATIDTPDAGAILAAVEARGWRLSHILNTHHHADHTGGNLALKAKTGCQIIGPRADADRIPGIDQEVGDGDRVVFGAHEAVVFDTPGHTRGHIVYWFEAALAAFVGDTLFAMGCGRLFEGTPTQMWSSLKKLMALPAQTRIYCAHEYTLANGRFAVTVDPDNVALAMRLKDVEAARALGRPTVPTTLGEELATNPFLRAGEPELAAAVGLAGAGPVEVFAEVRRRKDSF